MNKKQIMHLKKHRKRISYTHEDHELIKSILLDTGKKNIDNISRTKAYHYFFMRNPEIKWAFLASMVSRNAGWNMTDLEGSWYPHCLEKKVREDLFLTYERANWLIFSDAYPQLLLYENSKKLRRPLFHLLSAFHVSVFMEWQWKIFWEQHDKQKLMHALIINEQNVIQSPVVEHPIYKKKVFQSLPFKFQDWLHFSSVLFPTLHGKLYGFSVHQFRKVEERIKLGKKLGWLLFHPEYYHDFYSFAQRQEHTGSRHDYEQYVEPNKQRDTPYLRLTFPIIRHHRHHIFDWFKGKEPIKKWQELQKVKEPYHLTDWYKKKKTQFKACVLIGKLVNEKKRG